MRNSPGMEWIKNMVMSLPEFWQMNIYRIYYRTLLKHNMFTTSEPEFYCLHNWISPGDWAIDVGANVGIYTKMMSDLAGIDGRVISIEPVLRSFSLLSSNAQQFKHQNVTLVNVAASDAPSLKGLEIPLSQSGRVIYTRATLSSCMTEMRVLTIRIDDLALPHRVALVKIDVEGHESNVIKGMMNLIERDHPIMIIETRSLSLVQELRSLNYYERRHANSPNIFCVYKEPTCGDS